MVSYPPSSGVGHYTLYSKGRQAIKETPWQAP
jgi:hypothetical protein